MNSQNFQFPDKTAITNEAEAKVAIEAVKRGIEEYTANAMEWLSDVAVQYQIPVSIGEYGSGQDLVLKTSPWHNASVGEWISSSSQC